MGKWEAFKAKFPRWQDPNEKHRTKVDAAIERMRALDLDHEDLCMILRTLKGEKKRLEDALSVTQVEIDAAQVLFVDKLEQMGVSKFTTAVSLDEQTGESSGGDTFYVQPEPYASVRDRDANREWAVANGLESLLQIPWQTLNAMTKERLEAGEELPPGVEVFIKTKVGMRSA